MSVARYPLRSDVVKMNDRLHGTNILMLLDNPCDPDPRVEREASALAAAGANVRIVAWDRDTGNTETIDKQAFQIHRLPPSSTRKLGWKQFLYISKFCRNAWLYIRKDNISADIVYAHDVLMLPLAIFLAKKLKAKLVYDAHEIYFWMEAVRLPWMWRIAVKTIEAFCIARFVDLFVTVSQQRATDYWATVTKKKPVIVGNWYDPEDRDKAEARLKLGLEDGAKRVVAYVGGFSSNRRLGLLLELAVAAPEIHILIAGRGDENITRQIEAASRTSPNITYLGWQSDPKSILAAADCIYYMFDVGHPYCQFLAPNNLYQAIALNRYLISAGEGGRC